MNRDKIKRLIIIFSGLFFSLAALFLWASGGIQLPGVMEEAVYDYGQGSSSVAQSPARLVVSTWNISYAYGLGSSGKGYYARGIIYYSSRLKRIGEIIRKSKADIVLLQEADFNSHRSQHINQMKELARIAGLRYAAPAITWKAGYVPFPFWPPKSHFGAMSSGGAVLSRYPITTNRVTLYPKPGKNPWWYNLFYLFRYSQEVRIQCGNKDCVVMNNHLEAYGQGARIQQAHSIAKMAAKFSDSQDIVIIGGDMNAIPSQAKIRNGFPDAGGEDFRQDKTMEILYAISGFKEVVALDDYSSNEAAFFTFPAHAPNRRLDYMFVPERISVVQARIIPAGDLSDHLPVLAELKE